MRNNFFMFRVGGAFGGKERCFVALIAAVAAKKDQFINFHLKFKEGKVGKIPALGFIKPENTIYLQILKIFEEIFNIIL